MNDRYTDQVGSNQYGAVSGRGTATASLAVRCFMDMCMLLGLSCFVLFLDLTKAFDLAVRELVLGWAHSLPADTRSRRQHLLKVGIPDEFADEVLEWIESNWSLLATMGVPSNVIGTANSLHTSSWFRMVDSSLLVTCAGGRQGCKLGALIFNLLYSMALRRVKAALIAEGVVLHVRVPDGYFDLRGCETSFSNGEGVPVVEVTYVDDQAFLLGATSAKLLMQAIQLLLTHLVNIFRSFGLCINWKPGKTEGFVTFRGKGSALTKQKLYGECKAQIALPPGCDATSLRIVHEYVHLGSILQADCNQTADVKRRLSKACAAYAPLASKVYGSWKYSVRLRLSLAASLVFSRLLYNVHVWTTWTIAAYRRLNGFYMRVLRCIAGCRRFDSTCRLNDMAVRGLLEQPSLQCLIAKARLNLFSTIACNSSPCFGHALYQKQDR